MVDFTFLENFTKGNKDKMKRYINMYLDIAPKILEQMNQHVEDKDWEQLKIKAHSLKPQAEFIGVVKLKTILVDIEKGVAEQNYDALAQLNQLAGSTYLESEECLKEFITIH